MATVEPSSIAANIARYDHYSPSGGNISTDRAVKSSLAQDDIPIKLRCAVCNRLAVNAFRLPCCDQAICEACQTSLPAVCPVCEHTPISAEDCKPNKALRTTVKVFLKQRSQKNEKAKPQASVETPVRQPTPSTPAAIAPDTTTAPAVTPPVAGKDDIAAIEQSDPSHPSPGRADVTTNESQKDIPRESIEGLEQDHDPSVGDIVTQGAATVDGVANGGFDGDGSKNASGHQQGMVNGSHQQQGGKWAPGQVINQSQVLGDGLDFNAKSLPNMGWNASMEFNPMMPNMQNNMPGAWGTFPNMMGMPGMTMDPLGMNQGMYGGFGGQGMSMNGMGMGGSYNTGQTGYGGWNGQTAAWNEGQDNFNQNFSGSNAMGMGMGNDFGANSGYRPTVPNGGGYNHHGNYGQMQQHHFNHNEYQNGFTGHNQGSYQRGRGSGNGYSYGNRGRGGFKPASQGNHEPFHHQLPANILQQRQSTQQNQQQEQKKASEGEPDMMQTEADAKPTNTEATNEPLDKASEDDISEAKPQDNANPDAIVSPTVKDTDVKMTEGLTGKIEVVEDTRLAPIETYTADEPAEPAFEPTPIDSVPTLSATTISTPTGPAPPLGPAALYHNDASQNFAFRGRGSTRGYSRGTADYRGGFRGRGANYIANGINSATVKTSPTQSTPITSFPSIAPVAPPEPKGLGVDGAPKAPKALREGLPNTGLRGGRGFSIVGRAGYANTGTHVASSGPKSDSPDRRRSRTRSRSPERRHRRRHRHRSSSSSSDDSDRERRRERRHRRSRKHEEDDKLEEANGHLHRESSVESSKRASYRSRRDKDDRREKDDRSSEKNKSSSQRSHRERSRERDRSRERRHRRKDEVQPDERTKENGNELQPISPTSSRRKDKDREYPTSSKRDRDRKRSRRDRSASPETNEHDRHRSRRSRRDEPAPKEREKKLEVPQVDPHTLEREARNKERLLKEQQRRESLNAEREKKEVGRGARGKEDRKGRRVSYKYEDEESDEARALRVENEREAGRWG
ncbi:MAG: hypothetical protein M1812_001234 [Candelaria pacifica]|nr:MAG: hypothetical protein M1812_001234 [Candelaria pacifica]